MRGQDMIAGFSPFFAVASHLIFLNISLFFSNLFNNYIKPHKHVDTFGSTMIYYRRESK